MDTRETSFARPPFAEFLKEMVVACFPKVINDQGRFIIHRCAKCIGCLCEGNMTNCQNSKFHCFYTCIQSEAYHHDKVTEFSMLKLINRSLQQTDQDIQDDIDASFSHDDMHSFESTEMRKRCRRYKAYFIKAAHVPLQHTFEEYMQSIGRYVDDQNRGWYNWFKKQKPKQRAFELIQLLLYGILCPRHMDENEIESDDMRNQRIAGFMEELLTKYLGMTNMPKDAMQNYYSFTWQKEPTSETVLTAATHGLIGVVFFLINLYIHSNENEGTWNPEEQELIGRFLQVMIRSVSKANVYIDNFRKTQDPEVLHAQPYATDEDRRIRRKIDFIPPKELPWRDLSCDLTVHAIIQAPPAYGKTTLYQYLGTALLRESLPDSKRVYARELARQLCLGNKDGWVVIAINAQQFIWYLSAHALDECTDFVDMFFRGNLMHQQIPLEDIDMTMQTTVTKKVQDAYGSHQLVFLFDGFDELSTPETRKAFVCCLKNFYETFRSAHMFLFTRPINREDQRLLTHYFPQLFSLSTFGQDSRQTFPLWTHQLEEKFGKGHYQNVIRTPLVLTQLCRDQRNSLIDVMYDCIRQAILKEYDSLGRKMPILQETDKYQFLLCIERMAWNASINPNINIMDQLGRFMNLPSIHSSSDSHMTINEQAIHLLASQFGVLHYSEEIRDYRFLDMQIQAILAAEYVCHMLKVNVDPTTIRHLLQQLSNHMYWEIVFALIHFRTQPNSLLAELLVFDFCLRDWDNDYIEGIKQDIEAMLHGTYGATPFQNSKTDTLNRFLAILETKCHAHDGLA